MFVAAGARESLRAERRAAFAARFIQPLLAEAHTLGLSADELAAMVRDQAAAHPTSTPEGGAR